MIAKLLSGAAMLYLIMTSAVAQSIAVEQTMAVDRPIRGSELNETVCRRAADTRKISIKSPGIVGRACDVRYVRGLPSENPSTENVDDLEMALAGEGVWETIPFHSNDDSSYCAEQSRQLMQSLLETGYRCEGALVTRVSAEDAINGDESAVAHRAGGKATAVEAQAPDREVASNAIEIPNTDQVEPAPTKLRDVGDLIAEIQRQERAAALQMANVADSSTETVIANKATRKRGFGRFIKASFDESVGLVKGITGSDGADSSDQSRTASTENIPPTADDSTGAKVEHGFDLSNDPSNEMDQTAVVASGAHTRTTDDAGREDYVERTKFGEILPQATDGPIDLLATAKPVNRRARYRPRNASVIRITGAAVRPENLKVVASSTVSDISADTELGQGKRAGNDVSATASSTPATEKTMEEPIPTLAALDVVDPNVIAAAKENVDLDALKKSLNGYAAAWMRGDMKTFRRAFIDAPEKGRSARPIKAASFIDVSNKSIDGDGIKSKIENSFGDDGGFAPFAALLANDAPRYYRKSKDGVSIEVFGAQQLKPGVIRVSGALKRRQENGAYSVPEGFSVLMRKNDAGWLIERPAS
ncbi:MAG: hypothetical protein AAF720_05800 [Pseudomonadota bacterium]